MNTMTEWKKTVTYLNTAVAVSSKYV